MINFIQLSTRLSVLSIDKRVIVDETHVSCIQKRRVLAISADLPATAVAVDDQPNMIPVSALGKEVVIR